MTDLVTAISHTSSRLSQLSARFMNAPARPTNARVRRSVESLQVELLVAEDFERGMWAANNPFVHSVWGTRSVMSKNPPWGAESADSSGPNMLTAEERQYLRWVGRRVVADGAVLEIGPWLGQSTRCLLEGLPGDRSLTTVDDFVWRAAWMDGYLDDTGLATPGNHEDFSSLFRVLNNHLLQRMTVQRRRLNAYDGNQNIPPFEWEGGAIRLLAVDCGRTQEVNETWYRLLESSFVPGETLIVMQDWRLFREVPLRWYNQTRQFTDAHAQQLVLLHEVCEGGLASFVYVGADSR